MRLTGRLGGARWLSRRLCTSAGHACSAHPAASAGGGGGGGGAGLSPCRGLGEEGGGGRETHASCWGGGGQAGGGGVGWGGAEASAWPRARLLRVGGRATALCLQPRVSAGGWGGGARWRSRGGIRVPATRASGRGAGAVAVAVLPRLCLQVVPTLLSLLWVYLLPLWCPTWMEALLAFAVVFYYIPTFGASGGTMYVYCWLLCTAGLLAAMLWSVVMFALVGRASRRLATYSGSELPLFSLKWFAFHWFDMLLIRCMSNVGFFCVESALLPALANLAGGRVAPSALIGRFELCEPALQTVGRNSVFSRKAWLQPHTYDGHRLVLGGIRVGAGTHVMQGACLFPFSHAEDGVTVGRKTLVMKNEVLGPRTWWAGVPGQCVDPKTDASFAPFRTPPPLVLRTDSLHQPGPRRRV